MNIIDINHKIGREGYFDHNSTVAKQPYTDARICSVPEFISRLAKAPYDKAVRDLELPDVLELDQSSKTLTLDIDNEAMILAEREDLQTQMLSNPDLMKHYTDCVDSLVERYETVSAGSTTKVVMQDKATHIVNKLWEGHRLANLKELAKRQVLVGSPTWHHGCSDGDHFNIKEDLDSDKHAFLAKLGEEFGKAVVSTKGKIHRATNYTLPLTSSQGIILKSRRDSPQFRAVSKALQGRYAQLCNNESELLECIN